MIPKNPIRMTLNLPRAQRCGIDLRKRLELRRNLRIEFVQDSPRGRLSPSRVSASLSIVMRHGRARALKQIHVDGRTRRRIEAIFVRVAHDPDDRQQTQVAIHVPKLDRVADRVLIWPAAARERLADQGNVRSVRVVALVEHSPANQRNAENLEISVGGDAEIGGADAFLLLAQRVEASAVFGTSSCVISRNIPSGRPPSIGRALAAPTRARRGFV